MASEPLRDGLRRGRLRWPIR